MAKTESGNLKNSDEIKLVTGSYYRNEGRKKNSAMLDKKWAVGGLVGETVLTEAIIPVATGAAVNPIGFGIAAGVGVAATAIPFGIKSANNAYVKGKLIDEAKLFDQQQK
mmetsp:Transcript_25885/g.40176  ORF Transcript_25885/g.40176 Transcript_25885/m.40176 type:complete len:110 (+) Transcript_25885:259-588(+)